MSSSKKRNSLGIHLAAIGCLVLFVSACANVYKEPHLSAQTCEIRGDSHFDSDYFHGEVVPVKVDGVLVSIPPWKGGPFVIVPAGNHTVKICFGGSIRNDTGTDMSNLAEADFIGTFKPGRHYRIQSTTEGRRIYFSIVDAQTGEQVGKRVEGELRYFGPIEVRI